MMKPLLGLQICVNAVMSLIDSFMLSVLLWRLEVGARLLNIVLSRANFIGDFLHKLQSHIDVDLKRQYAHRFTHKH